MRFEIGCNLKELREYWGRSGYDGDLEYLLQAVVKDPSQLIVWRENNTVVGHAVWHETTTDEHRKGDARDREDREALEKLLGKTKSFVELHEIWLINEYRGKGHGTTFHDFFENLMQEKGYADVVFYANHPAAVALCRKQGYEEGGYLKGLEEYVFHLFLKKT